MIEFRTLGAIDLRDAQAAGTGRPLQSVLAQPKRVALLAYLTVAGSGRLHRRDALLGLFWPELSDQRGRAALSQALYTLRRALGDQVIVTRGDEEVGIDAAALWCDAAALKAALAGAQPRAALDLYAGEFLPAFHLPDAVEFDQWLETERTGLRRAAAQAAWGIVDQQAELANWPQAAHYARRALALQPYDETALRRCLDVLQHANDRSGAIEEYEAFAQRLRSDLELDVSAETRAALERVRVAQPNVTAPTGPVESALRPQPASRAPRAMLPLAVAGLVLLLIAAAVLRPRGPALKENRVVVAPLANETRDSALASVGRIAADWIAQGIAHTGALEVVRAGESGARLSVSGSYFRAGDSLVFQAHVTDAQNGAVLRGLGRASAPAHNPMAAIEVLRRRALGALAELRDPRLKDWAAVASQPPSFEAYQEYADGLGQYFVGTPAAHAAAVTHFRRAAAYDSSFTAPLLWAVFSMREAGQRAAADSLCRALERRREQLAPWDRAVLALHQAELRYDYPAAYAAAQRIAELTPNTEWRVMVARAALRIRRPREALRILLAIDPEQGWLRTWSPYWTMRLWARHMLAHHRAELQEARQAQALHPTDRFLPLQEMRALIGLGRLDQAVDLADSLAIARTAQLRRLEPYIVLANELGAHGRHAEQQRVLARALALTPPADPAQTRSFRWDRAFLMVAAERWPEALPLSRELLRADSSIDTRGLHGVAAAGAGERATALAMMASLEAEPSYNGAPTYQRALIAARLGDRAQAVKLLQQAFAEGWYVDLRVHASPLLQPLRSYAPFRKLMALD